MDHIKQGRALKHFVIPPPVPPKEEITAFKDGLKEAIPPKLEELLNRLENLRNKHNEDLCFVRQKTAIGSDEEYFLTLLAEHEFSEAYYIQKWLNYWLAIWTEATSKQISGRLQKRLSRFEQFEIEKAKQHPLQDLYEGKLRRYGSRFKGLCPFHKEETPSFYIFPDNHWFCFGVCNEGGDTVCFVMKLKTFSFPEAVRYLL